VKIVAFKLDQLRVDQCVLDMSVSKPFARAQPFVLNLYEARAKHDRTRISIKSKIRINWTVLISEALLDWLKFDILVKFLSHENLPEGF